jgi:hypothetical protein
MDTQDVTPHVIEDRDERLSRRRLLSLGVLISLGAIAALTACGEEEDEEDEEND